MSGSSAVTASGSSVSTSKSMSLTLPTVAGALLACFFSSVHPATLVAAESDSSRLEIQAQNSDVDSWDVDEARVQAITLALDQAEATVLEKATEGTPSRPGIESLRGLSQLAREVAKANAAQATNAPASLCRFIIGNPATGSFGNLCLLGRFVVIAAWENPFVAPGVLHAAGAAQLTSVSGYMWWQSITNMEAPVKMVSFCFENPPTYGVFVAGLTDFGVSLRIVDMITGVPLDIINPGGKTFDTQIIKTTRWPCL
jgi:hypothetical protein